MRALGVFGAIALALAAARPAGAGEAEVGQPAPPFELVGSDGETYTLERFVGKEAVVLAWFPKAFTPG
jgi:peroxiredoxin Q/BCP